MQSLNKNEKFISQIDMSVFIGFLVRNGSSLTLPLTVQGFTCENDSYGPTQSNKR